MSEGQVEDVVAPEDELATYRRAAVLQAVEEAGLALRLRGVQRLPLVMWQDGGYGLAGRDGHRQVLMAAREESGRLAIVARQRALVRAAAARVENLDAVQRELRKAWFAASTAHYIWGDYYSHVCWACDQAEHRKPDLSVLALEAARGIEVACRTALAWDAWSP